MTSRVQSPALKTLGLLAVWPLLLACLNGALCAASPFTSLMPKDRLDEFWTVEGTPSGTWRLERGEIVATGLPHGFLRSRKTYTNYVLRGEWRFKKEGWVAKPEDEGWPNAGFFINAAETIEGWPKSLEVQGHFGEVGSLFGVRGARIEDAKRGVIVKTNRPAFGQWDRYEITHKNGEVAVVLNGETVNRGRNAWPRTGNICLQSEGWEVHYRNIAIRELE